MTTSVPPGLKIPQPTAERSVPERPIAVGRKAYYAGRVGESALEGFDDLFHEEQDAILRAAYLVTGNQAIAAEVAQDAFAQAIVHWDKIRHYDRPGAWIRRVAIRQAVRIRRRDGRRYKLMIEASVTKPQRRSSDPSDRLEAALGVLTPKQRAMIVLHYFDDLPVNEAAEILGCRPATASVHLHRAR